MILEPACSQCLEQQLPFTGCPVGLGPPLRALYASLYCSSPHCGVVLTPNVLKGKVSRMEVKRLAHGLMYNKRNTDLSLGLWPQHSNA